MDLYYNSSLPIEYKLPEDRNFVLFAAAFPLPMSEMSYLCVFACLLTHHNYFALRIFMFHLF